MNELLDPNDSQIKQLLGRYRPLGPGTQLRRRVLDTGSSRPSNWRLWLPLATAAVLLISIGFNVRANRINQSSAASIGIGPAIWTRDADRAAELFGNDEAGRNYIELCLLAGSTPTNPGKQP